jgi:hypothetical protein
MHPELPPEASEQLTGNILPYLRLYPHRLHVPEVYGVCQLRESVPESVVILLENVPIDPSGQLYPSIEAMWTQASAVRQVYWLWQILELWSPLEEMGVASSLLVPDNLRVEGWRLRLRELYTDIVIDKEPAFATASTDSGASSSDVLTTETSSGVSAALIKPPVKASLQQLGECWESWCRKASVSVASQLREIAEQLQTEKPSLKAIAF